MNIKCLISPATQVLDQKIIQNLYRLTTNNSWKISIVGPLWWESTGDLGESAGNPESASTSWHHHEELCWLMESGTPWNWLQLTLKWNTLIFIQENTDIHNRPCYFLNTLKPIPQGTTLTYIILSCILFPNYYGWKEIKESYVSDPSIPHFANCQHIIAWINTQLDLLGRECQPTLH